ncbi:DUF2750 domain-containing protein [Citrobacter enshiensis]|uniref:DUF2750 domain-containing protein n=1 Tax=Citrobacter enshiensis TaxID=2971264 RepID=UPI0023E8EC25|nr:DUF2750 domain-containing protein [Citrobacter enshiensis]WET42267.1 DUF2750 domain-containing protein [Citrobacter enshiensis]
MKLSAKEIEIMSAKPNKDRYVYFIKRIVDSELLWVLDDGGFALSGDDSGNDMLMLWPAREYAEACIAEGWVNYKAKEIKLSYLMNNLLPDLSEKKIGIGVFMVPSTSDTPIISADSLLTDLKNECRKYN